MTYSTIHFDQDGPVATLRLNRPERMNAVIETMYEELQDALGRLERDRAVRAVILTGSVLERDGVAKQAFCAGADLKAHAGAIRTPAQQRAYIELAHDTTRRLAHHPQPVIAAVNGPARGAGAELVVCCDLVLMAEEATLAFPETGLGTFVGGGATFHLPRLVGLARARELVYTGRVIAGAEAVAIGLALAAVPLTELAAAAARLANTLAERAPISMRIAKRLLNESAESDLDTALVAETEAILECMTTDDWREGVEAFAERRRPSFKGQ